MLQAAAPRELYCTRITNVTDALRSLRAVSMSDSSATSWSTPTPRDYVLEIVQQSPTDAAALPCSWLVANQLGGGAATAIASAPDNKHLKFVPFAGAAACLGFADAALAAPHLDGKAFCFLPLPVSTRLPVHVNGFFELSSNRRDIWHGTDMSGDGRTRSEWNAALLRDIVAPCYVRVIEALARKWGPSQQFYDAWPLATLVDPWTTVKKRFFELIGTIEVMWTKAGGGRRIAPKAAVLMEDFASPEVPATAAAGAGGAAASQGTPVLAAGADASTLSAVYEALVEDGVPVVRLPKALVEALLSSGASSILVTPEFVRRHFKNSAVPHPSVRDRARAVALLKYCLRGLSGEQFRELVGLPLLPLADGSLGSFSRPVSVDRALVRELESFGYPRASVVLAVGMAQAQLVAKHTTRSTRPGHKPPPPVIPRDDLQTLAIQIMLDGVEGDADVVDVADVFVCSVAQYALLQPTSGASLVDRDIDPEVFDTLSLPEVEAATNVRIMQPANVAELLPSTVPPEWRSEKEVEWSPGERGQPTLDWLHSLWEYLVTEVDTLEPFEGTIPLIPTVNGTLCALTKDSLSVVVDPADLPAAVMVSACERRHCWFLRRPVH